MRTLPGNGKKIRVFWGQGGVESSCRFQTRILPSSLGWKLRGDARRNKVQDDEITELADEPVGTEGRTSGPRKFR